MNSRARPEIDDVIGAPHRFFIVLDHCRRVALVPQRRELRASAGYRADATQWFARPGRKALRANLSSFAAKRIRCDSPRLNVFAERPSAR